MSYNYKITFVRHTKYGEIRESPTKSREIFFIPNQTFAFWNKEFSKTLKDEMFS